MIPAGTPLLASTPVPVVELHDVIHIGSLDAGEKRSASHEGQGLSFSFNPDEWEEIASLGGNPRWTMDVESASFLAFHALTAEQREAVTVWGVERGYIEQVTAFRVRRWDSEWEEFMEFLVTDRAALDSEQAEWDNYGDEPDDGEEEGFSWSEEVTFIATETFPDSTVKPGDTGVDQILTTVWVNEATDFDGVWWEDDFDVDRMSAPRGVIVPRAIERWVETARPAD